MANANASAGSAASCTVIDAVFLGETGALALEFQSGRVAIRASRDVQGERLWTTGGHGNQ